MKKSVSVLLSASLAFSMAPAAALADTGDGSGSGMTFADADSNDTQQEVVWEVTDFTYGDYSKLLYGCDYSRQFTLSGKVITGLSESGLAKIAITTELVIPAKDDEGNTIVGVGQGAFKECGLTKVTFPTGMLTPYNDEATGWVTNRGNFIIAEEAFAKNSLTDVTLPNGVLAVLPNAFQSNQLKTVTLPRTIWWIETQAFAKNQIEKVNFPETCDFQLEMHGMAFADNQIKSVRLPDYTAVVNKYVFALNPGMKEVAAEASDKEKSLGGVVYMYADNVDLQFLDRIHTTDKTTASTKSWHQRLVTNDGSVETQNPDTESWNVGDFTYDLHEDGKTAIITGLSESGIAKRAVNRNLVIPDRDAQGNFVTEIASAAAGGNGLFGSAQEGFNTLVLPSKIEKIGSNVFQNNGLTDVTFPCGLKEIGSAAFQTNSLSSVMLPDTVTTLGAGAFATNPKIERIHISAKMTEVAASAFGCSDNKNWMAGLTELEIPEGITSIGSRAFAGNNIHDIVIPKGVTSIGTYAFSTKNYLSDPCTLTLPEGLITIGDRAFRNKVISTVDLPTTVTKLPTRVFEKEYSDDTESLVTTVNVKNAAQYLDSTNFPKSDYHKLAYANADQWVAEDFTYGTETFDLYPASNTSDKLTVEANVITGLSDSGAVKLEQNTDVVIPATDTAGAQVEGVATKAFYRLGLTSVTFPEGITAANDGWNDASVTARGNFFIGSSAFLGNKLTHLELPEGVITVENSAFSANNLVSVKCPKSLVKISNQAFARNSITQLDLPQSSDFPLNIDSMAFGVNKIKAVTLPSNIEKLDKWAFFQNTGMEPVTSGNTNEKQGGVVYLYVDSTDNFGAFVAYVSNAGSPSNVQEVKLGEIPASLAPWSTRHFTYSEDGATVTGLSDEGKEKLKGDSYLIIPDTAPDGTVVTAIGDGVLGSNTSAEQVGTFGFRETVEEATTAYVPTSVKLPSKLKSIGNNAFSAAPSNADGEHQGLTSVAFPSTLETIGNTAFQNAPLSSVELPDSVTSVGNAAFTTTENSVVKITSAKLSAGLTAIPPSMFTQQNVKSVKIPEGVTSIGQRAFAGNFTEKLTLPSTLESIGNYAFWNHQLSSLDVPANVKTIGNYAFQHTTENVAATLESLTLHEGLASIGNRAFLGSKLVSLDIPSTLTTLHKDAFAGGDNTVRLLTKVEDQANAVGDYTKVVTTGSGHVVELSKLAGTGWTLSDFTFSEDGATVTGYSEAGKAKRLSGQHDLVLPDYAPDGTLITAIGDDAFAVDDDEVTQANYEVSSPNGIRTVSLPSGLTSIGARAFKYNALREIDFAQVTELSSIGTSAFQGNKLQKVHIPDTVSEMGNGAFAMNSIVDLKLLSAITVIPQGAFSMNIRLSSIEIPDTVTEIGEMAFAGARLESLEIPASVVKIGRKAFHLHHIAELKIPGTVQEIGESAFEGTYKALTLTTLELGEGIETIGPKAFKEGLLTEVALPTTVTSLAADAFENNTGIDDKGRVRVVVQDKSQLSLLEGEGTFVLSYAGDDDSGDTGGNTGGNTGDNVGSDTSSSDAAVTSDDASKKAPKIFMVNVKTVTAKSVAKAAKKAGATTKSATSIVLGSKVKKVSAKAFAKYKNVKTVTLGKNVKRLKKNAFKGSKVTKLIVKTKKLLGKNVKGAFKASKIKTIKVDVSKKKATDKKYVKKYKKMLVKKTTGKKTTVKR